MSAVFFKFVSYFLLDDYMELPYPRNLKRISEFLEPYVRDKDGLWRGKDLSMSYFIKKGGIVKPDEDESSLYAGFNRYTLLRSVNQINASMNRLWTTCELHYHMREGKSDRFCDGFTMNFAQISSIPTLYYSSISAILSIMSLFGICSYAEREPKLKLYNVIRTEDGFKFYPREDYLKKIFGSCPIGWHKQVIFMYNAFKKKGVELPDINLNAIDKLKADRFFYDYDILGQSTMFGFHGEDKYFEHLPTVLNVIRIALSSMREVINPVPKDCEIRFVSLEKSIRKVFGIK